jgi:hypothetical protein
MPASQQQQAVGWHVGIFLAAVGGHFAVAAMAVVRAVLHMQPNIPKVSLLQGRETHLYEPISHILRLAPCIAVNPGPPPKPNPTEVNLPVLMFGPWTFPHSKNGCQYSFAKDKTTDQWPFGLCTLYDVQEPEGVDLVDAGRVLFCC